MVKNTKFTLHVLVWVVVKNTKFTLYVFGGGWWLKIPSLHYVYVFGGGWWLKNTTFTLRVFGGCGS